MFLILVHLFCLCNCFTDKFLILSMRCSLCIKFSKRCFWLWFDCSKWKLCNFCKSLRTVQLCPREPKVSDFLYVSLWKALFYFFSWKLTFFHYYCGYVYSLYCMPASLAVSCSSMQCPGSNLMLGNSTIQQSSAGCNVTSCNYDGYVNGTIMTT